MVRALAPLVDEQIGKGVEDPLNVIEKIIVDMVKLASRFPAVAADYFAVEDGGQDCVKRFLSFASEVQAVVAVGIPKWDNVLTAVETLLAKCTTNRKDNSEL